MGTDPMSLLSLRQSRLRHLARLLPIAIIISSGVHPASAFTMVQRDTDARYYARGDDFVPTVALVGGGGVPRAPTAPLINIFMISDGIDKNAIPTSS
ncbi:MAG: hypothetical protein ABR507_09160 [Actinomycetota bacterium]|nr:hypothetical protein [Actinomycetota bacterium]